MEAMPRHFTLQRRNHVVCHADPVEGHEVLDVYERTEAECKTILNRKVSFSGNVPENDIGRLETTVEDENNKHGNEKTKKERKKKRKGPEEKRDANRQPKTKRKKKNKKRKLD